jgi:hypothetical protein
MGEEIGFGEICQTLLKWQLPLTFGENVQTQAQIQLRFQCSDEMRFDLPIRSSRLVYCRWVGRLCCSQLSNDPLGTGGVQILDFGLLSR